MNQYKSISYSRACKITGQSRKTKYYKKKMPEKDKYIAELIKEVIGTSRKGREKVIRLIQKKHPEISSFKIRRVYERYGFSLTKKLRRRFKNNPANPIEISTKVNDERAMDFMSDSLYDGRKIRTLNVINHFNRKCMGLCVSSNFPARLVIRELEKIVEIHGKPKKIRTDNGPEFRSAIFKLWLHDNEIEHVRIQKGKTQQNAIIERFNRTFREDVLNAEIFRNVEHVQSLADSWRKEYNTVRPHQSLNYQTPAEYGK